METKNNEQSKRNDEKNEYFFNYIVDIETPLFHKDVYAFLNQVSNSNNILAELIKKHLPELYEKGLPEKFYKNFVIDEIVKPLKSNGKEIEFKNDLVNVIKNNSKTIQENKDNINSYYQAYQIKADTPLFHNDIYAFLNKVPDGRKYLQEITNIELPPVFNKDYVINEIVKPLKEAGVEKEIKASLIDIVNNLDTIKKTERQSINDYFKNFEIRTDVNINHKDIFAFIAQMPKKEGINFLKSVLPNVQFPENNKDFNKDFVINQIVKPIKEQGLDNFFKNGLIEAIQKSNIKNNDLTISETQIENDNNYIGKLDFYSNGGKIEETVYYKTEREYLDAIKKEMYYTPDGFKYTTITDNPTTRKAVDDIVYGAYGVDNPNDLDYYKNNRIETVKKKGVSETNQSKTEVEKIEEIIDILKSEKDKGNLLVSYKTNTFKSNIYYDIDIDNWKLSPVTFGNDKIKLKNYQELNKTELSEINSENASIEGLYNNTESISKVINQLELLKVGGAKNENEIVYYPDDPGHLLIEDIDILYSNFQEYKRQSNIKASNQQEESQEQVKIKMRR